MIDIPKAMWTPMLFVVHKEPPKGMDFDPSFGLELKSDPFPSKMLSDFDINELVDSLHLKMRKEYGRLEFYPERKCLEQLNHDQRWAMGCTILHSLEKFIGEILDERTLYNMISDIKKTLHYLSQLEIKPGVWDEGNKL